MDITRVYITTGLRVSNRGQWERQVMVSLVFEKVQQENLEVLSPEDATGHSFFLYFLPSLENYITTTNYPKFQYQFMEKKYNFYEKTKEHKRFLKLVMSCEFLSTNQYIKKK